MSGRHCGKCMNPYLSAEFCECPCHTHLDLALHFPTRYRDDRVFAPAPDTVAPLRPKARTLVDFEERTVTLDGSAPYTFRRSIRWDFLRYLLERPQRPIAYDTLIREVWDGSADRTSVAGVVHVIRQKFGDACPLVVTINTGVTWNAPVAHL